MATQTSPFTDVPSIRAKGEFDSDQRWNESGVLPRQETKPDTTEAGSTAPTKGGKSCKCGCGMRVQKHDYVWGHKSRSRITTIPMGEKEAGVTYLGNTPLLLALSSINEQIDMYKQKIEKLESIKLQMQAMIEGEE